MQPMQPGMGGQMYGQHMGSPQGMMMGGQPMGQPGMMQGGMGMGMQPGMMQGGMMQGGMGMQGHPGMGGQQMMGGGMMAGGMMQPGMQGGMGMQGQMGGKMGKQAKKQGKAGKYGQQQGGMMGQPKPQWWTVYYQQLMPQEVQMLQSWFQQADKDQSGEISAQELSQAQWPSGVTIDLATCEKLVKIFDQRALNRGQMSFMEFCALWKFVGHLQMAFVNADMNRSGALELNELQMGAINAGFQIDDYTLRPMLKKYTANGAAVQFPVFVQLMVFLAHVRSTFEKAANGQQQVTMDVNAFTRLVLMASV